MALVLARHAVFGEHLIPQRRLALHSDDWTPVEGSTEAPVVPLQFDPAAHTVPEVAAYYEQASASERLRVLEVERSALKPRTTVLALGEATKTPDAVGAGPTDTQEV